MSACAGGSSGGAELAGVEVRGGEAESGIPAAKAEVKPSRLLRLPARAPRFPVAIGGMTCTVRHPPPRVGRASRKQRGRPSPWGQRTLRQGIFAPRRSPAAAGRELPRSSSTPHPAVPRPQPPRSTVLRRPSSRRPYPVHPLLRPPVCPPPTVVRRLDVRPGVPRPSGSVLRRPFRPARRRRAWGGDGRRGADGRRERPDAAGLPFRGRLEAASGPVRVGSPAGGWPHDGSAPGHGIHPVAIRRCRPRADARASDPHRRCRYSAGAARRRW